MARGRPIGSEVRQHIIDILFFMEAAYGYEIYKQYVRLFPKITLRLIYYHLRKGVELEELSISEIRQEKGEYSWGKQAEKIYYSLGPQANPNPAPEVSRYFSKNAQMQTKDIKEAKNI